MTQELFLVLGWGMAQWRKAIQYHDQCNPDAPFGRRVTDIIGDMTTERLNQWRLLQRWWEERRLDQPGESKLLLPDNPVFHKTLLREAPKP